MNKAVDFFKQHAKINSFLNSKNKMKISSRRVRIQPQHTKNHEIPKNKLNRGISEIIEYFYALEQAAF